MKALVTGGTGFVGGHLIEALERRGDEVTALIRSPAKAERRLAPGTETVRGDLHDLEALRAATAGRDVVYHVAGQVAARGEAEFLRTNVEGTRNLVEAAARGGRPRLVLVSSLAAAGPSVPGRPLEGDEPPRPVTAYGRSKLAGEEVVRASALEWTIVRPPMVYGPRDTEVLKVFQLARLGIGAVFGDGSQELSAVYGPDLAEALAAAAASEAAVGRTYCACHPERFTSGEFVRAVGRALGRRVRVLRLPGGFSRLLLAAIGAAARTAGRATILDRDKANELLQPAWTGDPAPLSRDTGWRARHDLAAGLSATAAWYRDQGWL